MNDEQETPTVGRRVGLIGVDTVVVKPSEQEQPIASFVPATLAERSERSAEATWIAFTQVPIGAYLWNVTFREGMTNEGVDRAIEVLQYASVRLAEASGERPALEETRPNQPPTRRPASEAASSRSASTPQAGGGTDGRAKPSSGTERVIRLEIAGTLENPMVNMYSDNPKLQYPVFHPPTPIVIALLKKRYGEDCLDEKNAAKFGTCGMRMDVDWSVDWVRSEKNEKWRDVQDIRIAKWEKE